MARLAHCFAVPPPSLGSVHATHMHTHAMYTPCTHHNTGQHGGSRKYYQEQRLKPTPDQITPPEPGDTLRLSQDIIRVTVASCLLLGHHSILEVLKARRVMESPGSWAAGQLHTLRPEPGSALKGGAGKAGVGGCLQICLGTAVSSPRCFSIRQNEGLEKKKVKLENQSNHRKA